MEKFKNMQQNKITDERLNKVSGGMTAKEFFSTHTKEEAQRYLVSNGIAPNTERFKDFMDCWIRMNG